MTIDLTRLGLLIPRRGGPETGKDKVDGTLIGYGETGEGVYLESPDAKQAAHFALFGGSGAGKSVLAGEALVDEVTKTSPRNALRPALVVVDAAKGDLVAHVLKKLAKSAPERLKHVSYLDPFADGGGFPFNLARLKLGKTPLDLRAQQLSHLVGDVSTATGSQRHLGIGARQLDVLAAVVLGALAVPHPRASLLLAPDALRDQKSQRLLGAVTENARAREFLLSANLSDELRASTASRLRTAFASTDSLSRMIGSSGCIQFDELTAPGTITLVDLGRPIGGNSLRAFYASLIARLLIEYLLERESPYEGHHCRVVIDECQTIASVLSDRAEDILTTGRSKGLSLGLITQGTTLLQEASNTLLRTLLTNTRTRIVGRLGAPDAELFAREQSPSAGVDESVSSFRTRLSSTITSLPDRQFLLLRPGSRTRFRSIDADLEGEIEAFEKAAEAIVEVKARHKVRGDEMPPMRLQDLAPERSGSGPAAGAGGRRRSRWG